MTLREIRYRTFSHGWAFRPIMRHPLTMFNNDGSLPTYDVSSQPSLFNIVRGVAMARTASIGIRVEPDIKAAAETLAAEDRRTLAAWVEGLIIEALTKAGRLPPAPKESS